MRPCMQNPSVPLLTPLRGSEDDDHHKRGGVSTTLEPRILTKRPSMYKVIMLNDDYTPMEFVVHVLQQIFGMSSAQAHDVMMTVHSRGAALVGVFTFEIAETKVAQVMTLARKHEHPLQCTIEKE